MSPPLPPGPHLDLLMEALRLEAAAQRDLLAGASGWEAGFAEASDRYRDSFACAPPASWGRLIGMLKAAIISGDRARTLAAAEHARAVLDGVDPSPAAGYARAIAGLIAGDDAAARAGAEWMRAGDEAFGRAADAVEALAAGDADGYRAAVAGIVDDFAGRADHLTGVAIADTAIMFEALAAERGLAARPVSAVMPG